MILISYYKVYDKAHPSIKRKGTLLDTFLNKRDPQAH